jgi:uncharacterized protein (TIGR00730 family)
MRISVFCGSSRGRRPEYVSAAEELARTAARRGIGIVFGGGRVGLMGVVAEAALAAGGEVIGVIPRSLIARELGHAGLTEQHVVETMHERKALMAELSDGFVALPGGVGTMEELFEVWTWAGLGIHSKPVAMLDVGGYYDPLLEMTDRMVAEGFLHEAYRAALLVAREPGALLDAIAAYRPPLDRWSPPSGVKP